MASRSLVRGDSWPRATLPRAEMRWGWLLVAAAWTLALTATLTGQRYLIDHHFLIEESGLAWPVAAAVFLACWQVMIAAMMLPSALPALAVVTAATRDARRARARLAFLAGFAVAWTAFALLAFTGDTAIHRTVDGSPWLAAHAFAIGAATLAAAGLFQLTPLKGHCLAVCRNPRAFVDHRSREAPESAWRHGVRHGAWSVGCCWALMLIMFGIGVGGLGWMMGLTGAMLIEQALPQAWRARLALGAVLLLLAVLWLLHPAWLVPAVVS